VAQVVEHLNDSPSSNPLKHIPIYAYDSAWFIVATKYMFLGNKVRLVFYMRFCSLIMDGARRLKYINLYLVK
jgi:hypothetical protein